MRACVIFNPAAKGQKADRFRRCLDAVASVCTLKRTSFRGEARAFSAQAILDGFDTIIAAGGDGTVSEVLNGIGDVPDGFSRVRLGVLPLGTVNVFAREHGIPTQPDAAWQILQSAREQDFDLACVEHGPESARVKHYFAQMAGAGLDARAIELVSWGLKKKIGPLAYVLAGLKALCGAPAEIVVSNSHHTATGQMILIGNGRYYGGSFRIFPDASPNDGLLDVCVFPRANWFTLLHCAPPLLLCKKLPTSTVTRFRAKSFTLTSQGPAGFEIEGELIGKLPAVFSIDAARLRLLVPGT